MSVILKCDYPFPTPGAISPALSLSHASLAQHFLARGGVVGGSGVLAGGVLLDPAHQQAAAAAVHHAAHAHLVAGIHRLAWLLLTAVEPVELINNGENLSVNTTVSQL